MNQVQYRVARGVLRKPRKTLPNPKAVALSNSCDYIQQGELIPEGMLDEVSIQSLLSEGRIEVLAPLAAGLAAKVPAQQGKWGVDPVALVGKNLEELLIIVMEIDENFDVSTLTTEAQAIRQLTADWNPAFREEIARTTDRSRPEQMRMESSRDGRVVKGNVHDAGNRPLSGDAEKALANAKARAQAKTEAEPNDASAASESQS